MSKQKEVIPREGQSLAEIMQQNKTQFALCTYDEAKDRIVQCHQFVHCRDFMLDALVGLEDNRDISIYGFSYTKENPRLDAKVTSILVKFKDSGALKNFQDNFDILRDIETEMGFNHSVCELVDHPKHKEVVLWVIGDPRWQRANALFSLYTYLLKCLSYSFVKRADWMQEIKAAGTVESNYMDPDHIMYLIKNVGEILDRYTNVSGFKNQKSVGTHTIHNQSGFVSSKSAINGTRGYETHVLYGMRKAA